MAVRCEAFMKRTCLSAILLTLGCVASIAVPAQLTGKSVVIAWTENRTQRTVESGKILQVSNNFQASIYIGSTGRLFTRVAVNGTRGTGSHDHVGEGGTNQSGGASVAQLNGNSLVINSAFSGGARHVEANFDSGFSSCSAKVILGKANAGGTFRMKSLINGKEIEVLSSTVGAASCSIHTGNVFAN
jgi:hypothetical protein